MAILIILLLILLNGYFSLAEIALVTVKKEQLSNKEEDGNKAATKALQLIKDPESFLSAVQGGITLLGLLEGIYGGDLVASRLQPLLVKLDIGVWLAHTLALVLGIGFITYITIIIGELLPKSIALQAPLKVTLAVAPSLVLFSKIAYPFIKLLTWSTRLLLQLLHIKSQEEEQVSEQEIKRMLRAAYQQGTLEKAELQLHQNIFAFIDLTAGRMMKPMRLSRLIDDSWSHVEVVKFMQRFPYTHFPVYHETPGNIVSVISVKSFFLSDQQTWQERVEAPLTFGKDLKAKDVFDQFRDQQKDFAIVFDEQKIPAGIITMQDVMEGVFGDIPELETYSDYFYQINDKEWEAHGMIHLQRIRRILDFEWLRPYEEEALTVQELLQNVLGHPPEKDDTITLNNVVFTVQELGDEGVSKVTILLP